MPVGAYNIRIYDRSHDCDARCSAGSRLDGEEFFEGVGGIAADDSVVGQQQLDEEWNASNQCFLRQLHSQTTTTAQHSSL